MKRKGIKRMKRLKNLKSVKRTERQLGFMWKSEEFKTLIWMILSSGVLRVETLKSLET